MLKEKIFVAWIFNAFTCFALGNRWPHVNLDHRISLTSSNEKVEADRDNGRTDFNDQLSDSRTINYCRLRCGLQAISSSFDLQL